MGITAESGPFITFGTVISSTGGVTDYNDARGPSLVDLGDGLLDPRQQYGYGYQPGQSATQPTFGFYGLQAIVDYVPGVLSSNSIALNQAPVAATPLTLTASGVTVTQVTSILAPETGRSAGTLLAIDSPCGGSTAAGIAFGSAGTINIWNPGSLGSRCITMNAYGNSSLDGGNWSVAGRDCYGFKMTELIPASSQAMVSKKAYKYISSIVPCTTLNSTGVTVGVTDTYGFPMLVQHPAYISLWVGAPSSATLITANTGGHSFGSSLPTATSTNGDVRGTYASSVASNGTTMRVTMFISTPVGPAAAALSSYSGLNLIGPTNNYNLFGAAQFSSV